MRLLDFKDLRSQKGIPYTRRHLQRKVAAKEFPQPISLSTHRIAWVEEEIDQWVADRVAERARDGFKSLVAILIVALLLAAPSARSQEDGPPLLLTVTAGGCLQRPAHPTVRDGAEREPKF